MRRNTYLPLSLVAALAAACGGDDGDGDGVVTDAAVDAPVVLGCGAPKTTISTYPATYEGTVLGDGDDLTVGEGACADERGYFGASGEDHVIALTGLTAGTTYVLELTTDEDIMMYVTSTCDAAGPATGSCLLLVDETTGAEAGEFVAPAGGEITLIIDTPDKVTLVDGAYTLDIKAAQCVDDTGCTAGAPVCDDFTCVQCVTSFDCTAAGTPVCDITNNTCVAGGTSCTGDDAAEPDDGPAAARMVAYPTAVLPTTFTGSVCSLPDAERDWYRFTAAAAGNLRISVSWALATADIDFLVHDSTGAVVGTGLAVGAGPEAAVVELEAAGDYYLAVRQFGPDEAAPATPYTVTLSVPECANSFGCTLPAEPVCVVGECVAASAACTGDDGGEPDDGPATARLLAYPTAGVPTATSAAVCSQPAIEGDWYRVVATAAGTLNLSAAWTAVGADLDILVYDANGAGVAQGIGKGAGPETVAAALPAAGVYYIEIYQYEPGAAAAATAYTLTLTAP